MHIKAYMFLCAAVLPYPILVWGSVSAASEFVAWLITNL